MGVKNIIETPIVPNKIPKSTVINQGQYMLFVPFVAPNSPGIAIFDDSDFSIEKGKVSLRADKQSVIPNGIPRRDENGDIVVNETVEDERAAVSLGQAQKLFNQAAVKPVSARNILYGTNNSGIQASYPVSTGLVPNGVPLRDKSGRIQVPLFPINRDDAVSMHYVDGQYNSLRQKTEDLADMVAQLENLTLTHIEDDSPSHTSWTKVSPVGIGSPAFIKRIEGSTKRVAHYTSRNVVNPKVIASQFDKLDSVSYTLNTDGSITYTTDVSYAGNPDFEVCVGFSDLPYGTYYLYIEGHKDWWCDEVDGVLYINVGPDWDEENGVYNPTERTLKVMLSLAEEEDIGMWYVVLAPDGTVYEPYAEPTYSLEHQTPSQILSYSANLFGGSALLDSFITAYPTKVVVDYVNKTITIPSGNYDIPVNELVSRQDGPCLRFIVKGQGNFEWATQSYDNACVKITNTTSPETHISEWLGWPVYSILLNVRSESIIYYEECGTFISSMSGDISEISYVSDFQPYGEEPIGEFLVPDGYGLGIGVGGYNNSLEWKGDSFIATEKAREIFLDGSEVWYENYNLSTGLNKYFYTKRDTPLIANVCISDQYERQPLSISNNIVGINVAGVSGNSDCIVVRPENADNMTIADFKAQLAEKPIHMVVALATPEAIASSDIESTPNEIAACTYSIFRFFDNNGNELDTVANTIAYVVRRR